MKQNSKDAGKSIFISAIEGFFFNQTKKMTVRGNMRNWDCLSSQIGDRETKSDQ